MAKSMIAKFEKYWSDIPGVMAVATMLDPRYKLLRIDFHFGRLYGSDAYHQRDRVHELLKELIKEYEISMDSTLVEQVEEYSMDYSTAVLAGDEDYEVYKNQVASGMKKSELESNLDEQVGSNIAKFDILSWWKSNKTKYPILAKAARDILVIHVSTVASEFAFSAGGRFLSPDRRRLHPNTLEALMCTQNWIWAPLREKEKPEDDAMYLQCWLLAPAPTSLAPINDIDDKKVKEKLEDDATHLKCRPFAPTPAPTSPAPINEKKKPKDDAMYLKCWLLTPTPASSSQHTSMMIKKIIQSCCSSTATLVVASTFTVHATGAAQRAFYTLLHRDLCEGSWKWRW